MGRRGDEEHGNHRHDERQHMEEQKSRPGRGWRVRRECRMNETEDPIILKAAHHAGKPNW
jgi:hypothetical protein